MYKTLDEVMSAFNKQFIPALDYPSMKKMIEVYQDKQDIKSFIKEVWESGVEAGEKDILPTQEELDKECNCKESSCEKGCTKNHTCKEFWCEKCRPEPHKCPCGEDAPREELTWEEFKKKYPEPCTDARCAAANKCCCEPKAPGEESNWRQFFKEK